MEYSNLYQEKEDFGNSYRDTYQKGMFNLISKLQEKSNQERKKYEVEISENPEKFRSRIRETLGWPLTETTREKCEVKMTFVAKDDLASIYRVQIEVLPDLWMYGILFLRDENKKLPLVISQHGGGGTPELCSGFFGSANYNDMTKRILEHGVHVFAPQLMMWREERFGSEIYDRFEIDKKLKHFGSSFAAVTIDGLQKCIDWLLSTEYVLDEKIGMIGLSYGGCYTLYMAALDTRIKSALSSCYFNNKFKYDTSDWVWNNSANLFIDAEIGALVFPRKLWIQIATDDNLFNCESGVDEYKRLEKFYENKSENLHLEVFEGTHEFSHSDDGIKFVIDELNF